MRHFGPRLQWLLLLIPLWANAVVLSATESEQALVFRSGPDEKERRISAAGSLAHVQVTGMVATVTVWQLFQNPTDQVIDASYVFPIPEKVAVDRLQMLIGDRTVIGTVLEKLQAEQVYLQAAAEGRATSLVKRERSNIFSTSVANIPPRAMVEIVVGWQQEINYRDGVFSLRLPTRIMPRYDGRPPEATAHSPRLLGDELAFGAAPVPIGIKVDLLPGFPLEKIASPSHVVEIEESARRSYSVTLDKKVISGDRDFVLEWRPAPSPKPHLQLFSTTHDQTQHLMMLAIPPSGSAPRVAIDRTIILVIDTSGSMNGMKLRQAKASVSAALERLEPTDQFNVIRFSSSTGSLAPDPQWATPAALQDAKAWVNALEAGGGTEMLKPLRQALNADRAERRLRQIVFITDGQVANEEAIFRYLTSNIGNSRLFTVGIGPAPNTYFLRNAARHGRGDFTHVESEARVRRRITDVLTRLDMPIATDVTIDWPDPHAESLPHPIPDLYAGQPLVIAARLRPGGGSIVLRGWQGDTPWEQTIELPAPQSPEELEAEPWRDSGDDVLELPPGSAAMAIRKLWAARKIEGLTDSLLMSTANPEEVRQRVTEIALRYQLVTPYTSLVAEDDQAGVASGLSVEVSDADGFPLPGASVELTGPGVALSGVTGAAGDVRFDNLPPGSWYVMVSLPGFSSVEQPNLMIGDTGSLLLGVVLSSAVEDVITVTSESPLLDERQLDVGTAVPESELERLPAILGPAWAVGQTPAVTLDPSSNGRSDGGESAGFRGPGVSGTENMLLIDGTEIGDGGSDVGSLDSYRRESLVGIETTTGGVDVTKSSAGASVNLVTRRGTNEFRGSVHFMKTSDGSLGLTASASSLEQPDRALAENQEGFVGNRVDGATEYAFDAGGPAVANHLWLWGSFGHKDVLLSTGAATSAEAQPEKAVFESAAVKINAQLSSSNSLLGTWIDSDQLRNGLGGGPVRSPETAWNQHGGPAVLAIDDTHVFTSSFYVTGTYNRVESDSGLISKAVAEAGSSPGAAEALWTVEGVWLDGFWSGGSRHDSDEWKLNGSYFFAPWKASHEVKFGGRLREFEDSGPLDWPGRGLLHIDGHLFGLEDPLHLTVAHRGVLPHVSRQYGSVWMQDTIAWGALTANLGVRWDLQRGRNEALSIPGNAAFPDLLPALSFDGEAAPFEWETISPRVGVTYALGDDRDTLLRASFSQFPERLSAAHVAHTNPLRDAYAVLLFTDGNSNNKYDDPDNDASGDQLVGLAGWTGFDPEHPDASASVNRVDSGLEPSIVNELILGMEHSFLPEFVAGLNLTYRLTDSVLETREILADGTLATRDDFQIERWLVGDLPDGTAYRQPIYGLTSDRSGGSLLVNGDREVEYRGVSIHFVKRMSNRWAARGALSSGAAEWTVPASYSLAQDPTNLVGNQLPFIRGRVGDRDGDLFAGASDNSGGYPSFFLQSDWRYSLSGLYQVAADRPWAFNVAANVFGRQGAPLPYYHLAISSDGLPKAVQVTDRLNEVRTDDIMRIDLRLEKRLATSRNAWLTVSLDAFNLINETSVLQREFIANSARSGWISETLTPRIWQIGMQLGWR